MPISVKEGIEKGEFEDNERMARLDVIFAKRYIDAYIKYESKVATTSSWHVAFELSRKY